MVPQLALHLGVMRLNLCLLSLEHIFKPASLGLFYYFSYDATHEPPCLLCAPAL